MASENKREGLSFVQYEADGIQTNFTFSFRYIDREYITVKVGEADITDFTFVNANEINIDPAPAVGLIVTIRRETESTEKLVDFEDGGIITEELLDMQFDQVIDLVQEAKDVANQAVFVNLETMTGDAGFARLINVGDAVDPQDAMNKRTTDAMFNTYASEFDTELSEVVDLHNQVGVTKGQIDAIKLDYDAKYLEIVQIGEDAVDAKVAAETAQGLAETAQGLAETAQGLAEAAVGAAVDAKVATELIADSLEPMVTEFPAVKSSVEQLELDVADTVRLSAVQTVTNKTLSGAVIVNPTRTEFKSDTYNNLVSYAATADNGETVFAYDEKKFYGVVDGLLKDIGGGGTQDLDTIFQLTADENLNTWVYTTTAGSATFNKITDTNALQGGSSYSLYLNADASASSSVTLTSPEFILDNIFRSEDVRQCILDLSYTYNKVAPTVTINLQGYAVIGGWTTLATITPVKSMDTRVRYGQAKLNLTSLIQKVRLVITSGNLLPLQNFTLNFDSVRLYAINSDVYWGNIKGTLSDQTDLSTKLKSVEKYNTLYQVNSNSTTAPWIATLGTGGTFNAVGDSISNLADHSYKLILSSDIDIVSTEDITVAMKYRGKLNAIKLPYRLNATTTARIKVSIWDTTNSGSPVQLGDSKELEFTSSDLTVAGIVKDFTKVVFIPQTCTKIKVQFTSVAGTAGDTLLFDDVEISSNLNEAIVAKFDNTTGWVDYTPVVTNLGTVSQRTAKWRRNGPNLEVMARWTNGTVTSGNVELDPFPISGITALMNVNHVVGVYGTQGSGGSANPLTYITTGKIIFGSGNWSVPLTGTSLSTSGFTSIKYSIPIAEWSSQTNAAIVACKEGPLKCSNTYTAKLSSTQVLSDLNIPNWLTCTGGGSGAVNCVYNPNIVLASPMNCSADFGANGTISTDVYGPMVFPQTITGFTIRTWNSTASTGVYKDVIISCTKTGSDYNAGYEKVLGFTEDADIRSTEWLTGGFDYISGKPIYKRCHRVASDITTSGATLVTWSANLNPIGLNNMYADGWSITSYSSGANGANINYSKSSGVVIFERTGTLTKIGAGTTFCMEYVK